MTAKDPKIKILQLFQNKTLTNSTFNTNFQQLLEECKGHGETQCTSLDCEVHNTVETRQGHLTHEDNHQDSK